MLTNTAPAISQAMPAVEYRGQRVVTFAMIDEAHQRPDGSARQAFNRHIEHFISGTDFVKVSADEYRALLSSQYAIDTRKKCASIKDTRKKSAEKITEDVTLIFESGYLMVVKPFKDSLSWQVQRELVNSYFRPFAAFADIRPIPIPTLAELDAMPLQQAQSAIAAAERKSHWRHGKHGSAEMNQRRRELKLIRPAIAYLTAITQMTIPGLENVK
ncbi:ORF6N domain-containing protein [Pantoea sp. 1.19]|uniref:ORF6N domain-containing protein n=1 Tax=Pantoea sp. 1.19 TaxID=1925589 RepID=UPI000948C97B|nr:ORF6N domain-containing protein [Pantoea sp. 1.19]